MISCEINVNKADVTAKRDVPLTSGMKGVQATFHFDETWDGYEKTAVFYNNGQSAEIELTENTITIPQSLFARGGELIVGIVGEKGTSKVIPTVHASLGLIRQGTEVQ